MTAGDFSRAMPPAPKCRTLTTRSGANCSLPHDWAIEGPFDSRAQSAHRRPAHFRDRLVSQIVYRPRCREGPIPEHQFDGAQYNAHVFLNGEEIGSRPYGYISFSLDLTGLPQIRRPGKRAGGAVDARRSLLALVSRAPAFTATCGWMSPGRCTWPWGTYVTTPEGDRGKGRRHGRSGYPEPDEQRSPRDPADRDAGSRRKAGDASRRPPPMCPPEALKPWRPI